MLINRATGYLKENDTAQASEKSFQASKLVLMEYVRRLEVTTDVEIVPHHLDNPWSYKSLNKLCRLLAKKCDQDVANAIVAGWKSAYEFHIKGWTQNDLSVEDVTFALPFVLRFIHIVDKELMVNLEMATYVKENLFIFNNEEIATDIYKEANLEGSLSSCKT